MAQSQPNQRKSCDIGVLPTFGIVYDPAQREYYNTRSDIFLCEDDIKFYKLRPYSHIQIPLPKPLPPDYFSKWDHDANKDNP